MNIIKRVIDAERWNLSMKNGWFEASHNDSLERIEAAVMTYVTEIEQALGTPRKTGLKTAKPTGVVHREYHAAVVERLEQRIAELEAKVETYRHANGSKAARIEKMREQYEEDAWSRKQYIAELKAQRDEGRKLVKEAHELAAKRIAEMEAQVLKVVTPKIIGKDRLGFERYQCGCGITLRGVENYCFECGAKIDWT